MSAQRLDYVLGDVIVQVDSKVPPEKIIAQLAPLSAKAREGITVKPLVKGPTAIYLFHIDPNRYDENTLLTALQDVPQVLNAQRNHITQKRLLPNDPRIGQQWQYVNDGSGGGAVNADLDMDLAWDITTGGVTAEGDTIVVAVVDDGVNLVHPDLAANLWVNRLEIPNNGIDDDENGYLDDYFGWNARLDNATVDQDGSHGTPVTGIIAAVGNNELGVSGTNWNVKAMIIDGESPESVAIAAYGYALSQRLRYDQTDGAEGAFVVATNSSWGIQAGNPADAPIWCDFYNVMGEAGILSCGATTNTNTDVDIVGDLPTGCSSDYLISVTNLQRDDSKRPQAGFGLTTIDLGAYGSESYTLTRSGYGPFSGTSAATPHVAGVIALMYSVGCSDFIQAVKSDPALGALTVRDQLLFGTTPNDDLASITVTGGRLNAYNSVLNAQSSCNSACDEIYGVTTIEETVTTVELSYLPLPNQGTGVIRYRASGTSDWQETTFANGETISDLAPCTKYEFQTATTCDGITFDFSFTKVFTTSGCCAAPIAIEAEVSGTSTTFMWEAVPEVSSYSLEVQQLDSSDPPTIIQLDQSATTYTVSNVQNCQGYEATLIATCSISNRDSDPVSVIYNGPCGSCTDDYCDISAKDTKDEFIQIVSIGDVLTNDSGDDKGYGDFLGRFYIPLLHNSDYALRLTPGYNGTPFREQWSVYIDWDQDGDMTAGELVYATEEPTNEVIDTFFTVPESARLGITRMRVIMRFRDRNPSSCDDPEWVFGEYEDYCVTIFDSDSCPSSIQVTTDIDSTSTSLSFDLTTSLAIRDYTISFKTAAEPDYQSIVSTSPSIVIGNLEDCTEYEVIYSAVCNDDTPVPGGELLLKTKCSTAVNPEPPSTPISVFPNPSTSDFTLDNPEFATIQKIDIYTADGRLAMSHAPPHSSSGQTVVSTTQLVAGLYYIHIQLEQETLLKKWIKL